MLFKETWCSWCSLKGVVVEQDWLTILIFVWLFAGPKEKSTVGLFVARNLNADWSLCNICWFVSWSTILGVQDAQVCFFFKSWKASLISLLLGIWMQDWNICQQCTQLCWQAPQIKVMVRANLKSQVDLEFLAAVFSCLTKKLFHFCKKNQNNKLASLKAMLVWKYNALT